MIIIANMEREVSTGGVIIVHWRANKTDGEFSASSYGSCSFDPDPADPGYIPYDDLTEADVVGWVESSIDMVQLEANLDAQIEEQKSPKVEAGVPW